MIAVEAVGHGTRSGQATAETRDVGRDVCIVAQVCDGLQHGEREDLDRPRVCVFALR